MAKPMLPSGSAPKGIEHFIEAYAPNANRFLEWGSGDCTDLLCQIASGKPNPFVLSLHANASFQKELASRLPLHPFLHLRCVGYEPFSPTDPSYASYPLTMGLSFDVTIIRAGNLIECVLVAAQVISQGGIAIIQSKQVLPEVLRNNFEIIAETDELFVCRPIGVQRTERRKRIEKRCVVVVARGARAIEEMNITSPYIKEYAARVSAEYYVAGQDSTLPNHRLKATAVEYARKYERSLILDADIIIRPGSPDIFDIVPNDVVGAFAEGRIFPRQDWCAELNEIYRLKREISEHEYFNSGVLVLSNSNLELIEALKVDRIFGHPQFEQGFLNAKRVALGMRLHSLPSDLNYIPDHDTQPNDWRQAFFFHLAGSGKSRCLYPEIWEDQTGDRRTFSRRRFLSAHVRSLRLRQASEQIQGKKVWIFDPTDFYYVRRYANPILTENESIIAYFHECDDCSVRQLAMFGPKVYLEKGLWRGSFLQRDGAALEYSGAAFDVVASHGQVSVCPLADWPSQGIFEFDLKEDLDNIEFRIYRPLGAAELHCLRLEALD